MSDIEVDFSVSLTGLYDMLEKHDWSFLGVKDSDPDRYNEGAEWYAKIMAAAKTSDDHKDLLNNYEKHVYIKTPKPKKPEDK